MNANIDLHATTRDAVQRMLDALRNPACYPHPVQHVDILETPDAADSAALDRVRDWTLQEPSTPCPPVCATTDRKRRARMPWRP
jgi:hypothetical protein